MPDRRSRHEVSPPTDRESPVGAPVVRGDESVTGAHAEEAVRFDPDDPSSLESAAEHVARFAAADASDDHLFVLTGAAACAALVRGVGSYKLAAERASAAGGSEVTVSFIRKWARVHDLPRSVRRQVARGEIAPTAAKHVARLSGESRLLLAFAILDGELTVREVRDVVGAVDDGQELAAALAEVDVALGRVELDLPPELYRDLRREAALSDAEPSAVVAAALATYFE